MSGEDSLTTSFVDPALNRALQVERALNHVAKVVELELADVILSGEDMDEATRESLKNLGGTFMRLSGVGINLANSIAGALGGTPIPTQTSVALRQRVTDAPQTAPQTPLIPETVTPDQSQSRPRAEEESAPSPDNNTSRLDRVHHETSGNNASAAQKKTGREKQKFEGKLYEAIVSADETPQLELREGRTAKEVIITASVVINIRDNEITLEGHELFLFNGFMLLRDKLIATRDIRGLGFHPGASEGAAMQAFSKNVSELMTKVNQAAGVELIKKVGERANTKYVVNPDLTLVDKREIILTDSENSEDLKKN